MKAFDVWFFSTGCGAPSVHGMRTTLPLSSFRAPRVELDNSYSFRSLALAPNADCAAQPYPIVQSSPAAFFIPLEWPFQEDGLRYHARVIMSPPQSFFLSFGL